MRASGNICTDKLQSRGHFRIALASILQVDWIMYVLIQAAITRYHRLDGFNNKDFSMVLEAGESKIKVPADPEFGDSPPPGLRQMVTFYLCITWRRAEGIGGEGGRKPPLSSSV